MTEATPLSQAVALFTGPLSGLLSGDDENVRALIGQMDPLSYETEEMVRRATALVKPGEGVLWGMGQLDEVIAADMVEAGQKITEVLVEVDSLLPGTAVRDPVSMMLELVALTGGVEEALANDSGLLHGPLGPPSPMQGDVPVVGEMHRDHGAALGLDYNTESLKIDASYEATLSLCRREQVEASERMAVGKRVVDQFEQIGPALFTARGWREIAMGRLVWAGAEAEINSLIDNDIVEIAGLEAAQGAARCRSLAALWDSYMPIDEEGAADPRFDPQEAHVFWQSAAVMAYVEAARATMGDTGVIYLLGGSDPTLNDEGISRVGMIEL